VTQAVAPRPAGIEGFGKEATGAVRRSIDDAFLAYRAAVDRGEGRRACKLIATAVRSQYEAAVAGGGSGTGGCAALVGSLAVSRGGGRADGGSILGGAISHIRVAGTTAYVFFAKPGRPSSFVAVAKTSGDWRLASLEPTVVPPR
jgi:hypothetical protein